MPITLAQLSAFAAVAREGSVTAAADALAVSQPSVSGAVAGLGRELGCELLERSGRGVRLSPAGRAFAPFAGDVLGLLGAGRDAALVAAGLAARRLRVLAVPTAAESFVPGLVRAFGAARPDVSLELGVTSGREVLAAVGDHRAEVGICEFPAASLRSLGSAFEAAALLDDPLACVAAPDDPLAGRRRPVELVELAGRAWLLREPGSGTRALSDGLLATAGIAPRTMTLGSNAAVIGAAAAGLGVALLSRATVQAELDAGRLAELRLRGGAPTRTWCAICARVGPRREAIDAFRAFAAPELGGHGWR